LLHRTTAPAGAARTGRARRVTIAATAALAAALLLSTQSHAATLTATPGTLAGVYSSAQPGDTIQLASGSYSFSGGMKGEPAITLMPQAGAAPVLDLNFRPAQNIVIDGVTISDAIMANSQTRNITVRNSDIPGQVTFRTGELANANILFDHNVHHDWDKCGNCGEGRVWLPDKTDQPSGITIQNSEFRGGLSDGIQNGSNGTRIIGNTFHGLEPGSADGVHADAIQLYGSRNTLIRGNWFYDLANGVGIIMGADGIDHEVIEDNVFGPGNRRPWLDLWSDNGSVVRHNTFVGGACEYNARCGQISLGFKSADGPGSGTIIEDNVLTSIIAPSGVSYTSRYNLLSNQSPIGAGDQRGAAVFQGGAAPATYAGFQLAASSPGKGNASDGLDRGVRFGGTNPSGSGTPPQSKPKKRKRGRRDRKAIARWKAPARVKVGKRVLLDASRSKGNGRIKCKWAFQNARHTITYDRASGCKLRKAFTSPGRKYVRLTVRDRDGDTDRLRRSFRVRR
jgi:hypothetical protein